MTTQDQSIVLAAAKEAEAEELSQNEVSRLFWYTFQAFSDCQRRIGSQGSHTFLK